MRYSGEMSDSSPNTPPFEDPAAVHRWMAIECNNAAWDLLEQPTMTDDETDRAMTLACTSQWHWQHAGRPENHLRAGLLGATACWRGDAIASAGRHLKRVAPLLEHGNTFDHATWACCEMKVEACGVDVPAPALGDLDADHLLESLESGDAALLRQIFAPRNC